MPFVGMDTQGARELGRVLQKTAKRTGTVRRDVVAALDLADLASEVPKQLDLVEDGFTTLSAGVLDKVELAERFLDDPQGTSKELATQEETLGAALSGLFGMAGPSDLRGFLVGLPASGADPELDAALDRLDPVLLPALLAGARPELTEAQLADLRLVALALGIEHAGPPSRPPEVAEPSGGGGLFWRVANAGPRTGTEVFWNDFWADGRTVEQVMADPQRLLEWVAGTFELDRRLAAATELPELVDVLASVDFATGATGQPGPEQFAAISDWLPAFLVGQEQADPDPTQLAQTLAFAARVGWQDPGPEALTEAQRFDAAVAFLRANRALQSALLPTGFEGLPGPHAFFNEPGIALTLDHGRRSGVIDDAFLGNLASLVDQQLAAAGVDLSGPAPVELTEPVQAQLFALVAGQLPASLVASPVIQAEFIAALGYLRQATSGADQRQRILDMVAAFRTLAVAGGPALTERQLVSVVGDQVLQQLGQGRLRFRSEANLRKNPEFLLVAQAWGVPGSHRQEIGKYKFSWGFNELGELTQLRRKKKSWWSRAWDTIKSIGNAIVESWKDNPFKAIFEVGKLVLGAAAFFVPGLQGLGAAAFAVNLAGAAYNAIEGNWLAAIGAGLSAFTSGMTDIFGIEAPTSLIDIEQAAFVKDLLNQDVASALATAKRAFDIGASAFQAIQGFQAGSAVAGIAGALGAAGTALGSGGQLLQGFGEIDAELAGQLARIGTSLRNVAGLVTPAAGLVEALKNGEALAAFANGLSVISVGALTLVNPKGAFTDKSLVEGTLFAFDPPTKQMLVTLAQGTGVAANLARAVDAANRGNAFAAGAFLAQAIQVVNNPRFTETGKQALVAQRIGELAAILEAVYRSGNPAAGQVVAPLVVQRLNAVLDALNRKVGDLPAGDQANIPEIPPIPVAP